MEKEGTFTDAEVDASLNKIFKKYDKLLRELAKN